MSVAGRGIIAALIRTGAALLRALGPRRTRSGVNESILIRVARPLFPVLSLQEMDVNFRAVDTNKFASAIGQAGRRQQQKELLEIEALNGALDGKYGVGVGYGVEETVPTPRSVNAHDADAISAAERHAFGSFVVLCHFSRSHH